MPHAVVLVPSSTAGEVLPLREGLSFWGGVDPESGLIIDAHHPDHGACLSGRIVMMPSSRGSCSGSGVLLELALNDCAPAALIFCEDESTLTLGAIVASELFERNIAVLRLDTQSYNRVALAKHAEIRETALCFDAEEIALSAIAQAPMKLSDYDQHMLAGRTGEAAKIAMRTLCIMAAVDRAPRLIDVSRAHIDGCILAHDANLVFAEKMLALGAKVQIPTTINAISVAQDNWRGLGMPEAFANKANRLANAYVAMGAQATMTCAPYLLENPPAANEAVGWSESNAVIYANSILGARSAKHPDYLDLFIAITGRAPDCGVYRSEQRQAQVEVHVSLPPMYDDAVWPMLGWLLGTLAPNSIPLMTGLEAARPSSDDLKALCAAFGTTSAAPMLHIRGHTPEGNRDASPDCAKHHIQAQDLEKVWQGFNEPDVQSLELIAIGSPHASVGECELLARLLKGRHCAADTSFIVTLGRSVYAQLEKRDIVAQLESAGVTLICDMCWCSMTEPVFPVEAKTLMTNSGKYAHYA
ncbi:aconitase X, partial [Congregibacter sp.]